MSDEFGVMYNLITSLLPQLFLSVFLPMILVGIVTRFMRNPAK